MAYGRKHHNPYMFSAADLRNPHYRPKLADVRELLAAYDEERNQAERLLTILLEAQAENDELRDGILRREV